MNSFSSVSVLTLISHRKRFRRRAFFLWSLFLLGIFLTPFSVGAANLRNEKLLTIQGIVVDEQNQPVANVKVFIDASDYYEVGLKNLEARTDAQGKFTLTGKATWIRGATVQAEDSKGMLAQISLPLWRQEVGPDLNQLCLQLKPPRRVVLEVVDSEGQPIVNAKTGIMAETKVWGIGTTDSRGKITFPIPHDVELKYAVAFSDHHGADYKAYSLQSEQKPDANSSPPVFPHHPVRLQLEGTQPVKIKVQSADGKPIAGIRLAPWNLNKPDQLGALNLAGVFYTSQWLEQTTDAAGLAVFSWMPQWQKQRVIFAQESEKYVPRRIVYDPAKKIGSLTIQLKPKASSAGKVDIP